MADVLKNTFDIKTVVTIVVFIAGLIANNFKSKYEQALQYEKMSSDFNIRIDKLESTIKNRDDLQDRDILDVKNQQRIDEEVIKSQNFLISNLQKPN